MAVAVSDTLEILDFLVASPEQIIGFQTPEELQERLDYLLEQNREGALSALEAAELDDILEFNRFMNQLRLRMRERLVTR